MKYIDKVSDVKPGDRIYKIIENGFVYYDVLCPHPKDEHCIIALRIGMEPERVNLGILDRWVLGTEEDAMDAYLEMLRDILERCENHYKRYKEKKRIREKKYEA